MKPSRFLIRSEEREPVDINGGIAVSPDTTCTISDQQQCKSNYTTEDSK